MSFDHEIKKKKKNLGFQKAKEMFFWAKFSIIDLFPTRLI